MADAPKSFLVAIGQLHSQSLNSFECSRYLLRRIGAAALIKDPVTSRVCSFARDPPSSQGCRRSSRECLFTVVKIPTSWKSRAHISISCGLNSCKIHGALAVLQKVAGECTLTNISRYDCTLETISELPMINTIRHLCTTSKVLLDAAILRHFGPTRHKSYKVETGNLLRRLRRPAFHFRASTARTAPITELRRMSTTSMDDKVIALIDKSYPGARGAGDDPAKLSSAIFKDVEVGTYDSLHGCPAQTNLAFSTRPPRRQRSSNGSLHPHTSHHPAKTAQRLQSASHHSTLTSLHGAHCSAASLRSPTSPCL